MSDATKITLLNDGPLYVEGQFKIVTPTGQEIPVEGKAALCRCGASSRKPFCDGAHGKVGFKASEEA